jgi:CBS-domain-containing membrane protein
MVPLSEYATVTAGCTLREAVLALEKAQKEFDHTRYRHRAILVLDGANRVMGKLSHLDALRVFIPEHDGDFGTDDLSRFGFSNQFIRKLHQQRLKQTVPLTELCKNAGAFKVEDYMCVPTEDECIDYRADLTTAIHQLVQENLRSLLVTRQGDIVGILRLTDLFSEVYHNMAQCPA